MTSRVEDCPSSSLHISMGTCEMFPIPLLYYHGRTASHGLTTYCEPAFSHYCIARVVKLRSARFILRRPWWLQHVHFRHLIVLCCAHPVRTLVTASTQVAWWSVPGLPNKIAVTDILIYSVPIRQYRLYVMLLQRTR